MAQLSRLLASCDDHLSTFPSLRGSPLLPLHRNHVRYPGFRHLVWRNGELAIHRWRFSVKSLYSLRREERNRNKDITFVHKPGIFGRQKFWTYLIPIQFYPMRIGIRFHRSLNVPGLHLQSTTSTWFVSWQLNIKIRLKRIWHLSVACHLPVFWNCILFNSSLWCVTHFREIIVLSWNLGLFKS